MRRGLLLAVAAGALPVPAAAAGTITWAPPTPAVPDLACGKVPAPCGVEARPASIAYVAAPGERNVVTLTAPEPGVVLLRDEAGIAALPDLCAAVDALTASCAAGLVTGVVLGDGDDVATVDPAVPLGVGAAAGVGGGDGGDVISASSASGGRGDDRLTGAWLDGGPGADVLTGTEGPDDVTAGGGDTVSLLGGDDQVRLDGAGGNTVDGGEGTDGVSYGASSTGVTVDLAGGPATDTVTRVESASGSQADDRLTGTDGPDHLDGAGGEDVLRGLGGDDVLVAASRSGSGSRLDGGPGLDTLAGLGFDDLSDCGAGGGRLALTDGGQPVPAQITTDFAWPVRTASCAGPAPAALVPVAKAGRVGLQELHCGAGAGTVTGCRVTLALSASGRTVGSRTLRLAPGTSTVERAAIPVRLRRRILSSRGATRVVLRVTRQVTFRDLTQVTDTAGPYRVQVRRRDLR